MAGRNPDSTVRILDFAPNLVTDLANAIAAALAGVTVTIPAEVEVKNDDGNPVPVEDAAIAALLAEETGRLRFDYGARVDGQPEYIGLAPASGQDSADVVWRVLHFEYASAADDADTVQFDTREPLAWDNRSDPTADGLTAWGF